MLCYMIVSIQSIFSYTSRKDSCRCMRVKPDDGVEIKDTRRWSLGLNSCQYPWSSSEPLRVPPNLGTQAREQKDHFLGNIETSPGTETDRESMALEALETIYRGASVLWHSVRSRREGNGARVQMYTLRVALAESLFTSTFLFTLIFTDISLYSPPCFLPQ